MGLDAIGRSRIGHDDARILTSSDIDAVQSALKLVKRGRDGHQVVLLRDQAVGNFCPASFSI